MKQIVLFLFLVLILFFSACAQSKIYCPSQDVVEVIITPLGPIIIGTPKGSYSEEHHGREQFLRGNGWITLEEYQAWQKEIKEENRI